MIRFYGTTTWQVTTDADTAFANPVVNVTNTNETLYNVTTLAADALYRARVRQTSTEGTESHFSDVNDLKQQRLFQQIKLLQIPIPAVIQFR